MATGINKAEAFTPDAETVESLKRKKTLKSSSCCDVSLSLKGKARAEEVLSQQGCNLSSLSGNLLCAGEIDVKKHDYLIFADNLEGMLSLRPYFMKKIRLIYADPPYNTGLSFHGRSLQHAYTDSMPLDQYVEFMRQRFIVMRELLADDGSLYVHIGVDMLGYFKVMLDEIFGAKNCRNIISRRSCSSKNFTAKNYPRLNDYILFYTKTDSYVWNRPGREPELEWIEKEYSKVDSRGRYKLVPIHAPGKRNGATGMPWRDMHPPKGKHWQLPPVELERLDQEGFIHWSRNGNPRRKVYLEKNKKVPYTDYWPDFRDAHHQSIRITGYPTEKNLNMLRMIVGASSNPNDIVLDPFSGSGTTLHAASLEGRNAIGIDQSVEAIRATISRFLLGLKPMGDFVPQKPNVQQDISGLILNGDVKSNNDFRNGKLLELIVDSDVLSSLREKYATLEDFLVTDIF